MVAASSVESLVAMTDPQPSVTQEEEKVTQIVFGEGITVEMAEFVFFFLIVTNRGDSG